MMQRYDFSKNPGRWRSGPIFVRDDESGARVYQGPDAASVNALAHELTEVLNNPPAGSPPMVVAAMAHLNLVMIHPFSDGNGRMGRVLQTMVLARGGHVAKEFCSIEEYLGRNRQAYYDVLAQVGAGSWHPERDARPCAVLPDSPLQAGVHAGAPRECHGENVGPAGARDVAAGAPRTQYPGACRGRARAQNQKRHVSEGGGHFGQCREPGPEVALRRRPAGATGRQAGAALHGG